MMRRAWNWQRWVQVPQFWHVSVSCWAMYCEAKTWFGMPNLTMALREWQQQEQQLHMTSGLSLPLKVNAMWTRPASCERFSAVKAWASVICLAPRLMASLASLSKLRQTSNGALHLCHLARQPHSSSVMTLAFRRMASTLVMSRMVCWP